MKKPLKNLRCAECGALSETLLTGRCPECVRRITAQAGDWHIAQVLVRTFGRPDKHYLKLVIRQNEAHGNWTLDAAESSDHDETIHQARIGRYSTLPLSIASGERFGRRWVENAPGTSIATYVPRPEAS